jgi:hypothetical protein
MIFPIAGLRVTRPGGRAGRVSVCVSIVAGPLADVSTLAHGVDGLSTVSWRGPGKARVIVPECCSECWAR